MSVTIFPAGNGEFCEANNLVAYNEYECQCVDFLEHFPADGPKCRACGGSGKIQFPYHPFEMNLANGNFRTFWSSLGLDTGEYLGGGIHPQEVLNALNSYDPALGIRAEQRSTGAGGCRVINCGVDLDRVNDYVTGLREIAEEALRRGVDIVWG